MRIRLSKCLIIFTMHYCIESYQLNLICNDRSLKRFGKRLLTQLRSAVRKPLRHNRSNITTLDLEIKPNFSSIIIPKRIYSLLGQRALSLKKNNPNKENSCMEVLNFSNGKLSGDYDTNGSDFLLDSEETAIIRLEKKNGEFGFNIVGGIDQEYIPGDPGIFISRIRNDGSAFHDRRLKIGDRIISVDGILLAGKTHDDVVQLLHNTKNSAVFMIEQNAESRVLNKPTELSGILNSDESTSLAKGMQNSLSSSQRTSMSSKSATQITPESIEIRKKESSLLSTNGAVHLASNSTDSDYAGGKNVTKDEANKIKLSDDERISEVLSVSTASPFSC